MDARFVIKYFRVGSTSKKTFLECYDSITFEDTFHTTINLRNFKVSEDEVVQMWKNVHWHNDVRKIAHFKFYTRNSSCITLLWLHHNHKMSVSYHKIALVSRHQSVGRWLIFCVFCGKNILTKLVGYIISLLVSVSRWNLWLEINRFHVNCIHFRGAAFVHVGSAQLCTENGISFYICSAVEVAWLARNNRRSSTCVWLHLQWRLGVSSE